jgi:integrase
LSYDGYYRALKRYCRELGITKIGTHGLRHSTSELYMKFGASRDDLRILFGDSNSKVTDIYIHDKGQRLAAVADNISLLGCAGS